MSLLEAENLYRFFHTGDEETLALQGVSLTLDRGETLAVTGPSGSGKSTLLACLAGLDDPDGGSVRIAGERISRLGEERRAAIRARSIGVLYQQSNLMGHLSVEQNIALAQHYAGAGDAVAWRRELLEMCGVAHRSHARPLELSGGELARAGLATALANDPAVVLADEPTGELDSTTAEQILALLAGRARSGSCVVIVTHSRELAAEADSIMTLRDGRVRG
ncbi:ABC transporter ATP-binding protein [soil metagenome]